MLLRLFAAEKEKAVRWIRDLSEYSPGTINKRLEELEIVPIEYALYSFQSDRTHPNLISMLAAVEETEVASGRFNIQWGVGGRHNERFIRLALVNLIALQMLALYGGLTNLYKGFLSADEYIWYRILDSVSGAAEIVGLGLDDDRTELAATPAIRRIDLKVKRMEEKLVGALQRMNAGT